MGRRWLPTTSTTTFLQTLVALGLTAARQGLGIWPLILGGVFLAFVDHFLGRWVVALVLLIGATVLYVVLSKYPPSSASTAHENPVSPSPPPNCSPLSPENQQDFHEGKNNTSLSADPPQTTIPPSTV